MVYPTRKLPYHIMDNLSRLPYHAIKSIAQNLCDKDLDALSLTCKYVRDNIVCNPQLMERIKCYNILPFLAYLEKMYDEQYTLDITRCKDHLNNISTIISYNLLRHTLYRDDGFVRVRIPLWFSPRIDPDPNVVQKISTMLEQATNIKSLIHVKEDKDVSQRVIHDIYFDGTRFVRESYSRTWVIKPMFELSQECTIHNISTRFGKEVKYVINPTNLNIEFIFSYTNYMLLINSVLNKEVPTEIFRPKDGDIASPCTKCYMKQYLDHKYSTTGDTDDCLEE